MTQTDYSLRELSNAEIQEGMGGPNTWVVRFPDGTIDLVGKSPKNRLIIEDNILDEVPVTYGGVRFSADFENDRYQLSRDGQSVTVPRDKHEHVLWAVHDEDGQRLNKLFNELHVPRVRRGVADMLTPRFRQDPSDIRKTEDGWVVSDDILVTWEGENHPVNLAQTFVVRSGSTVEADETKQAREIDFHIPDDTTVTLPNGTHTELLDVEVEFFTTVGLLLGTGATTQYDDALTEAIQGSSITAFTDTRSGLHHNHGIEKHRLGDLGVTEAALDRLWYNEYDHAGVHELAVRRREFENAPISVFEDAPNDDPAKWQKIENTSEKAPIPRSVRQDLRERYE